MNDGAIHVELAPVDTALGVEFTLQVPYNRLKGTIFGPASEPVINSLPVAIPFRHIPPRGPGAQDPKDAIDDLSVVVVRAAPTFNLRQEVLDAFILLIGEFIAASRHGRTARLVLKPVRTVHTGFLSDSA